MGWPGRNLVLFALEKIKKHKILAHKRDQITDFLEFGPFRMVKVNSIHHLIVIEVGS